MLTNTAGSRTPATVIRRTCGALAIGLSLLACASLQAAADHRSRTYHFSIDRKPRQDSLNALAKHIKEVTMGSLMSPAEELELVGPLECECTIEEALSVLLRGSNTRARWVDAGSLYVEPWPPGPDAAAITPNMHGTPPSLLGSMIVAGSALHASSVYTTPLAILDRERIDEIGAPTLGELLRQLIQQNVAGRQTDGSQYFDVHGLGSRASRVLLNGRRVWPSAGSLISDAVDLNSIPLAAVERIEVLPPAASALYGIDVLGGIVNVVLRRRANPAAEVYHSGVAGGGEYDQAVLTVGAEGSRAGGMITIEYTHAEGLLGSARTLWRDQDFRRFTGGVDQRTLNTVPNITSWSGDSLPGLDTTFGAISSATAMLTPGLRNYDSAYRDHSVVPDETRFNAVAVGEVKLSPGAALYGELLHASHTSVEQFAPPALAGQVVSADNPHNPLGVPVTVNAALNLGTQRQHINSDLTRALAGIVGSLNQWRWDFSVLHSQEAAHAHQDNAVDLDRLSLALQHTDPAQALNAFVAGPVGEPGLLSQLLADRSIERQRSQGEQVTAVVRGPLLKTRAGDLSLTLGEEWRVERTAFNRPDPTAKREVTSTIAELYAPLVSEQQQVPLVRTLSARFALRSDDYSDYERLSRPQYGLVWSPHSVLTLHATYGKTVRPPSLYEQFAPKVAAFAQAADPLRNGEQASFRVYRGGAADLPVSSGTSLDAGLELTPSTDKALVLSINYWDISIAHRSALLPVQTALASDWAQARIERDAPSPADTAAGRPGPVRIADLSRLDLGRLDASGVDLSLSHRIGTKVGRFTPRFDAGWIRHFRTEESGAFVDRAGVASEYGSIPRWRAIASLNWEMGAVNIFGAVHYGAHYADAIAGIPTGQSIPAQRRMDLNAAVDLGRLGLTQSRISVGATDVFDQGASYARVGGPAGFDVTQSQLEGRRVFVRLTQKF